MQHQDHIHFQLMKCKEQHVTVRVTSFLKRSLFLTLSITPFSEGE